MHHGAEKRDREGFPVHGSTQDGLGLELPCLEATQALPSRWFLSLERQRQGARQSQRIHSWESSAPASSSSALMGPPAVRNLTTFPTHEAKLSALGHTWPPTDTPEQGLGEGRPHLPSPSPRVILAPGSAIKQDPHSHLCLQREATERNLTQIPF